MSASLDDAILAAGKAPDPFELFGTWLQEAIRCEPNDPTAMALATVDPDGLPDVRMVLLKQHDAAGFVFFTNLESAKGRQLAARPLAALLFHWKSLRRQVRLRGPVVPVMEAEANAYFATRPRISQLGAWASDQSRPAPNRVELERRVATREAQFPGTVPRPPHWSGYRLAPHSLEFWRDGPHRLHDRFLYTRTAEGWRIRRLFP